MVRLIHRALHVLPSPVLLPYVIYEHARHMSAPLQKLRQGGSQPGLDQSNLTEDLESRTDQASLAMGTLNTRHTNPGNHLG
jgi:hypothetical protein